MLQHVIRLGVSVSCALTTTHHHPLRGRRDEEARLFAQPHRVRFSVDVELQTFAEHELEPARLRDRLQLWLDDQYAVSAGDTTSSVLARAMLDQLREWYGDTRGARVDVREHDEAGAFAELPWRAGPGRHPRPIVPE